MLIKVSEKFNRGKRKKDASVCVADQNVDYKFSISASIRYKCTNIEITLPQFGSSRCG